MEIQINLLQERTSGRAALVDLTIPEVPDVPGSPIRMSSPPGIGWSQGVGYSSAGGVVLESGGGNGLGVGSIGGWFSRLVLDSEPK